MLTASVFNEGNNNVPSSGNEGSYSEEKSQLSSANGAGGGNGENSNEVGNEIGNGNNKNENNNGKKGKKGARALSARKRSRLILIRITLTAMFITLAYVTKSVTKLSLASFGAEGMQISFGGIFTFFPAILFGPVYGGIASAMTDFLGAMLTPTGAYIPWLTLTAFLGGFIKGVLWIVLTKKSTAKIRYIMLAVFVVIGALGFGFSSSLSSDGVMPEGSFFIAEKTALPTRGQIDAMELDGLSGVAAGLARYNRDNFTLNEIDESCVDEDGTLALPVSITLDGYQTNITRLSAAAFDGFTEQGLAGVKRIVIPAVYTTVPDAVLDRFDKSSVMIITDKGSTAAKAAIAVGFSVSEASPTEAEISLILSSSSAANEEKNIFQGSGMTLKSSDTYRKYLAGYINLAAGGLSLAGLIGTVFVLLNLLLEYFDRRRAAAGQSTPTVAADFNFNKDNKDNKDNIDNEDNKDNKDNKKNKKGKKKSFDVSGFLRIAVAITCSGCIVTTINTFILKIYLPAWSGRLFTVLLIPRLCEEIIISLIQAYVICLIYGLLEQTLFSKLKGSVGSGGRGRF